MIIDLAKRCSNIDEDLSIIINVIDGMYSLGVYANEIGTMYSYSSTDLSDAYNRVNKFIDALSSNEKFDKLVEEVLEKALEE